MVELLIPDSIKSNLLRLRKKYFLEEPATLANFREIYDKFLRLRKERLVDSLIASANLTYHFLDNPQDPLAIKAIEMTNPNFDPNNLQEYSDEQLLGVINSAKGKYFELLVAEKLNAGESVGGIALPNGFTATIAEKMNQPGWDIVIEDPDGNVSDYLQLKATESLSYITEALSKYPDIKILTTDEVANALSNDNLMIIDSDISDHELTDAVSTTIDNADPGVVDKFLHSFHPLTPLSIILAIEGYKIATNKQSIEVGIKNGSERFGRSIFSSGVGALVIALGGGFLGIPAAFLAGIYYRTKMGMRDISETLGSHIANLRTMVKYQQMKMGHQNGIL